MMWMMMHSDDEADWLGVGEELPMLMPQQPLV